MRCSFCVRERSDRLWVSGPQSPFISYIVSTVINKIKKRGNTSWLHSNTVIKLDNFTATMTRK